MSSKATCTLIHYDILLHILESLSGDNGTLKQCALVNREFNRAASSVLYARVKLSPPFKRVLDLKDRGELPVSYISYYFALCALIASIAIYVHVGLQLSKCTARGGTGDQWYVDNCIYIIGTDCCIPVIYYRTRLLISSATPTERTLEYAFECPTNVQESYQPYINTLNIS